MFPMGGITMKMVAKLITPALLAFLLIGMPEMTQARVMMTGIVNQSSGFNFGILESAMFSVDDWLSTPNLWWLTIDNSAMGDTLTVTEAKIYVNIDSGRYPGIIQDGLVYLVGRGTKYLRTSLLPGEKLPVDNILVSSGAHMSGRWSKEFKDEVLRIGYLPEGTYTLSFILRGKYSNGQTFDEKDVDPIEATIEIRNPRPPELVTPDNGSDNTVAIPRFSWQTPAVSDLSQLNKTIRVSYTITLWKMFSETGATLTQEEAIRRIPIWQKTGLTAPFVDFDPGSAREELMSGRRYCWQVQGFDATGRFISATNEGKSDIWEFSVRFTPAVLIEPVLFFPLRFSWIAAQAGGNTILYDVSVADNQEFSRAYTAKGQILTAFTYPSDAPQLEPGKTLYLKIQPTDDRGIPVGSPTLHTFTLPANEIALSTPEDNTTIPSLTPTFRWQGIGKSYVVIISDDNGKVIGNSGKVEGTSWAYDGEQLKRGTAYNWKVAPSDDRGEPAGAASDERRFSTPETTQVLLVGPINMNIDSTLPTFTWQPYSESDTEITYVIAIAGEDGVGVHSAPVAGTTYKYPETAAPLKYGAKYLWSVKALRNNSLIGTPSPNAWFTTPYVASAGTTASLSDIEAAIRLVLGDYPDYSQIKDMNIISIRDMSGPITPAQFMELLGKYRITSVNAR